MNRRSLLKSIGFSTLLSGAPISPALAFSKGEPSNRKRVLRVAHITDVHAQPAAGAPRGFEKCLHHIQNQPQKVDLIFNGGDSIMDALHKSKSNVSRQWKVWQDVLRSECSLPVESCIGNHDVWAKGPLDDLSYGKGWVKDIMEIKSTYKSFDQAGWHFIILDSIHPRVNGEWYTARLDEEQIDWLRSDLKKGPAGTPVMVLSHIPILAACVLLDGENCSSGDWKFPGGWMHTDNQEIVKLFYKTGNVKLCLSGHIHLKDRVEYNGVTYLCNGAVSGAWWSGKYHQTPPGYAIIDLFNDGTFEHEYVRYS